MQRQPAYGDRSKLLAYLFWIFGFIGLHRFYLGRPLSGVLYLLTVGVFGLGIIYDLFTLNEQIAEANKTSEW